MTTPDFTTKNAVLRAAICFVGPLDELHSRKLEQPAMITNLGRSRIVPFEIQSAVFSDSQLDSRTFCIELDGKRLTTDSVATGTLDRVHRALPVFTLVKSAMRFAENLCLPSNHALVWLPLDEFENHTTESANGIRRPMHSHFLVNPAGKYFDVVDGIEAGFLLMHLRGHVSRGQTNSVPIPVERFVVPDWMDSQVYFSPSA